MSPNSRQWLPQVLAHRGASLTVEGQLLAVPETIVNGERLVVFNKAYNIREPKKILRLVPWRTARRAATNCVCFMHVPAFVAGAAEWMVLENGISPLHGKRPGVQGPIDDVFSGALN